MADLADARDAIVGLLAAAIYPNGTSATSATGYPTRIYAGWPKPSALDLDMAGNVLVNGAPTANGVGPIVNVSVYPRPGVERITSRYQRDWQLVTPGVPTLTATVVGQTIVIDGVVTVGQYVTSLVNESAYSYAAQTSDTLASMASALATLINAGWASTTSLGPVITLPSVAGGLIVARVSAPGTSILELGRQQQSFQITIWAPNDVMRTATARVVNSTLMAADFLSLLDGSQAWLVPQGQNESDEREVATIYRRDVFYWVEYATTQTATSYPITAAVTTTQGVNWANQLGSSVTTTD